VPIESPEESKEVHPYDKLNKDHAFVIAGGGAHILWETSVQHDKGTVEHLDIGAIDVSVLPTFILIGANFNLNAPMSRCSTVPLSC
jgi:hypothetical protein